MNQLGCDAASRCAPGKSFTSNKFLHIESYCEGVVSSETSCTDMCGVKFVDLPKHGAYLL